MDHFTRCTFSVAKTISPWSKRMQLTVPDKFSGKNPITALRFSSSFQVVREKNGIHGGTVLLSENRRYAIDVEMISHEDIKFVREI